MITPRKRRKVSIVVLVLSIVGWVITRVLYFLGVITVDALNGITNDLSWLALTISAADLVATTDVRAQGEED